MWEVMNRYGITLHITDLIKKLYEVNTCQVEHEGKLSDTIAINTEVRKGCSLSPIIFLMVMDDVMNKVILGKKSEINWNISEQLEDLDFADDICFLSHTFNKMDMKLNDLQNIGKTVRSKSNFQKAMSLRINPQCNMNFQIRGENIEEIEKFTYLGSEITRDEDRCENMYPENKFSLHTVV
jgi:hypothetical protein